jgi:hypothetical protein
MAPMGRSVASDPIPARWNRDLLESQANSAFALLPMPLRRMSTRAWERGTGAGAGAGLRVLEDRLRRLSMRS